MFRNCCLWLLGLILMSAASVALAQEVSDLKGLPENTEVGAPAMPSLEVSSEPELAAYETELRYRMTLQLIAFVIGLVVLHFAQVKLKIPRAYFWFVVGGVILGLVLNSYRPQVDIRDESTPIETAPTYAPTHAR